MKVLAGIVVALLVLVLAGLGFVYSGAYNVAATNEHTGLLAWVLRTTMAHSVRRHAADLPPAPPSTPAAMKKAARRYAQMCAQCHGAPGSAPDETGKGLMPPPPELATAASEWSERELFWIIKNGVQFTGMPAWGETHDDAELWELAHFVKALPAMSAEQFQAMAGQVRRLHAH